MKVASELGGIGMFVVFEDYASATGPKVHKSSCHYFQRWKRNRTTTTTWHGPYATENQAWKKCTQIAQRTSMKPSRAGCC